MRASHTTRSNLWQKIHAELVPAPGRFAGSLRDVLGITIALLIGLTLRVPGLPLALALLFVVRRERPHLTLRSGLEVTAGAAAACAAAFFWVQITDGSDVLRFFGVVAGIFIASFGMSATTLPVFFTNFGLYGFINLAAWDSHHSANSIVTATLYNLAALVLVMLSAVAVEYVFAIDHPAAELRQEMNARLRALSRFYHALAQPPGSLGRGELNSLHHALVQYANAGDVRMNELYDRIRDVAPELSGVPLGMHYRTGLLSRVLEKSILVGLHAMRNRSAHDRGYFAGIAKLCDSLLGDSAPLPSEDLPRSAPARLIDIQTELQQYAGSLAAPAEASASRLRRTSGVRDTFRLFLPGAFESREAVTHALKLTLAATICYVLYNALAWPGILTCVITVLFTGLSSTGAMKQKQLYRFAGAAIGGLLAIATESLLFPNMDSVASLILVVGAVSLLAAWVARSPRMGYVGVQLGFAFFLTTLQGFSAATEIAPARDRVIGVALGTLVMWFIFDQLWPTRTTDALRQILRRIRGAAAELREKGQQSESDGFGQALSRLRVLVSLKLAEVQLLGSAAWFDFGRGHRRELARSRRLIREIESAAADFYSEAVRLDSGQPARSVR